MINAEEGTMKPLERIQYLERLMPKICLQKFFRNKGLDALKQRHFLKRNMK